MLQCTAVTQVPYAETLLALATMEGGPEHPPDVVEPEDFVLCELGDHDESAEHAAHLWTADVPDDRDLWFLWSGTGAHRVHRLDTLRLCPAVLREMATRTVTTCAFFDHHPGPHSFSVTDPSANSSPTTSTARSGDSSPRTTLPTYPTPTRPDGDRRFSTP